jgi:hypothetical protein
MCLQCRLEFAGIYLYRLSREYSEPEEHIRLLSYHEDCHGFLMQKQNSVTLSITKIEYIASSMRSNVASQASDRFT